MITFSKELLKKLRASLLTAFKLKNIQAYRLGRDRNVAHACFRPITSTVSIVSDFVANGYQTIAACFHKPPYDPGKPDFPVPVLTLIYLRSSFHPIWGSSADTHTPLYLMVYFQGRFYSLLTSPSCPVTQEAIKCPEPLCTLKVLPLTPKCLALRQQTLLCLHCSYGLMRQS